jgi:tetratricopeptide (TPR) repeat protein
MSLHSLGKYEQAIEAFQKNVAIAKNPGAMYNIACGYSRLKQTDKAFEWLEKALSGGAAQFVKMEADADLENIRADARFKQMTELADRKKRPCVYSAEARQFDFWVGDWDVFNLAGQKVGTNSIQMFADGCGVMENWTDTVGGSGKSINYYDASTQKWYQHWIGSGGGALRYAGNFKENAMRFEGETMSNGKKTLQRLTFFKIDENTVRQLSETSADEGKTWTVSYDFKYVKKK